MLPLSSSLDPSLSAKRRAERCLDTFPLPAGSVLPSGILPGVSGFEFAADPRWLLYTVPDASGRPCKVSQRMHACREVDPRSLTAVNCAHCERPAAQDALMWVNVWSEDEAGNGAREIYRRQGTSCTY